jgi:NADH-quinone oxidoreductase subunit L
MYVLWEVSVIISYFLVTFDGKNSSLKSALKMMVNNKFGDIGFIISMAALFHVSGSLSFGEKIFIGNDAQLGKLEIIALIMALSIFIKSSQIGNWLKNAMCAPIPASALIHSSASLTAGLFLLIRLQNLFECSELIQNAIISVGLFSAIAYSTKAIFSDTLEEMFSHSTCSQIGLMMVACGFSSYGAALILFISHAFSKSSLLFSTGSVIHALSGEQDIKSMGGLFELLPKTYISFILAVASMIGIPLLPSYYSRKVLLNEIIGSNLSMYHIALILIIITSILTSIYFFRMAHLMFHGEMKLTETSLAYLDENENFIIYPLYVSVFFAIFSGVFFYYAVYSDVIWTDVFAFSYVEDGYAIFTFSIVNLIGIAAAILICRSIKSMDLSIKLNWGISNDLKNSISRVIESVDTRFYKKCYLFMARQMKSK